MAKGELENLQNLVQVIKQKNIADAESHLLWAAPPLKDVLENI